MPRSSVVDGGPPDKGVSPEPELLTVEQAAAYLQMHKVTVYKYIRAGLLQYLNRLSDLLFVLARVANSRAGRSDVVWKKRSNTEGKREEGRGKKEHDA